ncbi:MAG: aminotransferase class I/II-fold pyridoxal phosphate-dependent enzyme [Bacillota bacterium]|nr:aminotransferase class I/II-fold pyridoxal phosphate-dependent enzyme [Bacillota bacterium]
MNLKILLNENIERFNMPENLKTGIMVSEQHKICTKLGCDFDYYQLALGQSPFFVPEIIQKSLANNTGAGYYSESDGIMELREKIAVFNKKYFDLDIDTSRIIVGPGTKTLLFMIFSIVNAKLIIPTPSWIGYSPLLDFLKKDHVRFPLSSDNNYKIDPDELSTFLTKHDDRHMLLINNPNNPTGAVYSDQELKNIVDICRKNNTLILSDEIYALTTYDFNRFTSVSKLYPEGTFVTNGLSKDRSAGGYRLGTCILPKQEDTELRDAFVKLAASLYSNVSTPVQLAAVTAYEGNSEIEEYFNITRKIHKLIGLAIRDKCNDIDGLSASVPEGGFYFILDFNEYSEKLINNGIKNSNQLSKALLAHPYHVATVTGDSILVDSDNFVARIAFVDYDGKEAYEDFIHNHPSKDHEIERFINKHAGHMLEGIDQIEKFLEELE